MKIEPNHFARTKKTSWLVMLPGPPRELRPMFDNSVVPLLKREFAAEIFVCRTLRSTGIGESRVQEMLEDSLQPFVKTGLEIGYCARPGAVDVRLARQRCERGKSLCAMARPSCKKSSAKTFLGLMMMRLKTSRCVC